MKYMAGYQLRADDDWIDALLEAKESLYEVFFSWGDMPNGRGTVGAVQNMPSWQALDRQRHDLERISGAGIKLNLLLNANCYGAASQSRALFNEIGETVEAVGSDYGLSSVTTTSPLIARFIKDNFEGLEVRASVNMSIGTVQGMETVERYFDGFYMQREYNHDIRQIRRLKSWCGERGKRLYLLANSGCFNFCAAHHFHDNLVAHEKEISRMDNAMDFRGVCWEMLDGAEGKRRILCNTNFIRPEDMPLYEGLFDAAKLATRVSANPMKILRAYTSGRYAGSVLDLCEPNHSGAFYPDLLENSLFPEDYGRKRLDCGGECRRCGYCEEVYDKIRITLNEGGND